MSVLLGSGAPVYASVAPSFTAYFNGIGIASIRAGLKQLGFADAEETAIGATFVKREYERISREGVQSVVITSCCPTVNTLIEKYYPEITECLAPVMTPMQAHCMDIKRRHSDAKTVFIGPCLSKKDEAARVGVDAALTFEEIAAMFAKKGIVLESRRDHDEKSRARLFPTSGGVLNTMTYKNPLYDYYTIDGLDNVIPALEDIRHGGIEHCFIEMSACAGSCVRGPIMRRKHPSSVRDYQAVSSYAGKEDFNVEQPEVSQLVNEYRPAFLHKVKPSHTELMEILRKMGKVSPADELNCGTCGYNTCREKAVAIYQGKAEISMCLPYLKDRSERLAGNILDHSPNGFIVLNEKLEIQQINRSALAMMNLRAAGDVLGEPVVRVLDPGDFFAVLENGQSIEKKRVYLSEYDRYAEETIIPDHEFHQIICILRDVTEEERVRRQKEELSRQTAEIADGVVEKQMRIVQEIASLLGETAAETKIALYKLKGSVSDE